MHALSSALAAPAIEERLLPVEGASLFVRRAGGDRPGMALVTVHGGPGISHEVMELLEPLARPDRAVVSFDQRGVGRSTGTVDEGDVFGQAVADLDAVVRASGTGPVHLLGHSWGGLIAALYAAAHPASLASLVLVDSIPATSELLSAALQRREARVHDFQARGLVPAELPGWERDATDHLLALLPIYFLDPAHPSARTLGGSRFSAAASRACAGALASYDVRAAVARVAAPTLHAIAPVPFGQQMAASLADAMTAAPSRRLVLADAGHLPWLERPAPFLAQLDAFLTEIDRNLSPGDRP
jgi:pimeloyl-ACP methyl ester carboxylesterase